MATRKQDGSKLEKIWEVVGFFCCVPIIGGMLLFAVVVALAIGAEKTYNRRRNTKEGP